MQELLCTLRVYTIECENISTKLNCKKQIGFIDKSINLFAVLLLEYTDAHRLEFFIGSFDRMAQFIAVFRS